MRYRLICLFLLFTLQSNLFSFHPRFRDEFYIENKTGENIVVVFETMGLIGARLKYPYDEENYVIFNFNGGANAPDKHFRTVRSRMLYDIGFSQYNYQDFNEKTPKEKFKAFFKFILIFNDKGDLLFRIDDFDKCKIEDRSTGAIGMYVLVTPG